MSVDDIPPLGVVSQSCLLLSEFELSCRRRRAFTTGGFLVDGEGVGVTFSSVRVAPEVFDLASLVTAAVRGGGGLLLFSMAEPLEGLPIGTSAPVA